MPQQVRNIGQNPQVRYAAVTFIYSPTERKTIKFYIQFNGLQTHPES